MTQPYVHHGSPPTRDLSWSTQALKHVPESDEHIFGFSVTNRGCVTTDEETIFVRGAEPHHGCFSVFVVVGHGLDQRETLYFYVSCIL